MPTCAVRWRPTSSATIRRPRSPPTGASGSSRSPMTRRARALRAATCSTSASSPATRGASVRSRRRGIRGKASCRSASGPSCGGRGSGDRPDGAPRGHRASYLCYLGGVESVPTTGRVKRRGKLFRKYVVLFVAVVTGALLANGLIEIYFSYVENKAALVALQQEK